MMPQPTTVTMTNITFTYPSASSPLFEHVGATFPRGWSAVLGDNGIGKTTLLHLLAGRLQPDSGSVTPDPAKMIVGYCDQAIDKAPANIEDFAADWSPYAIELRQALGIDDEWLYRFGTLSGGEAKRVQIACACVRQPDVLILDEPTNHVDGAARASIIEAMRGYQGIGIVISHDVELIDQVCRRCVMFERRHVGGENVTVVDTYHGNYTQAAAASSQVERSSQDALNAARREHSRLQAVKAGRFARVQHIDALKRHGERINPHDHDALNAHKGAKAGSRDKDAARSYTQLDARIASTQRRTQDVKVAAKRYDASNLAIDVEPSKRSELLHIDAQDLAECMAARGLEHATLTSTTDSATGESRSLPSLPLPTLSIGPHDHIAIVGANGAGKTTLMNVMLSRIDPHIRMVHIAQNTTSLDADAALAALAKLAKESTSLVLSAYAQLNADPDKLLAGGMPSPGELRKLLLCMGLLRQPELIALDEPTNHLDLHSKEALARMLASYRGALIVVSHDVWFLDQLASLDASTSHTLSVAVMGARRM